MFRYNSSFYYDIETINHDQNHASSTRTFGARNVLWHRFPELVYQFPTDMIERQRIIVSLPLQIV